MKCRICKGEKFETILNLGHHPPSDAFLTEGQINEPEISYPLNLVQCMKCRLVQIDYVVPPEILFQNDYPYITGINKGGIDHFKAFAEDVQRKYGKKDDFVVDIGGNDGTLLRFFQEYGCKVLNIDPSGVESKVVTMKRFFDKPTARFIKYRNGKADIILATNVFAHCNELHEFMSGVGILLNDNGVFVVESPCLEDMIKYYQFDQIYHEHLSYFSFYPMNYLVGMHDMYIEGVEHNEMHGGSNRYFIKKIRKASREEPVRFNNSISTVEIAESLYCGG